MNKIGLNYVAKMQQLAFIYPNKCYLTVFSKKNANFPMFIINNNKKQRSN